jgi:hypothetical protein
MARSIAHAARLAPSTARGLRLALLALAVIVAGCAPPTRDGEVGTGDAAAAPAVAHGASPGEALPEGPLQLLAFRPADGSSLMTRARFQFVFDRPLDPASISPRAVAMEYLDPGVILLVDPFDFIGVTLAADARSIVVEPPELLAGKIVRVNLTDALAARDGRRLERNDLEPLPPGVMRRFTYHVLELPP